MLFQPKFFDLTVKVSNKKMLLAYAFMFIISRDRAFVNIAQKTSFAKS